MNLTETPTKIDVDSTYIPHIQNTLSGERKN